MGAQQFGRTVENKSYADNVEVDIQRNTANQFDDEITAQDVSSTAYETGEQNISGAKEVSGMVTVNDSNDADITIQWTDGGESLNPFARSTPSPRQ